MGDKYVNPLSAAKLVVLVKSALSDKLDKTGGTITGDLGVNGDVHSNGAIQSDLLLSAPAVTVYNDAADSTVNIACTGDNSARISSLGSDGELRYSRLAVGTPTGDNDAATKAYVDSKARAEDYAVNISLATPNVPTGIDGGIAQFAATCDKIFAEIKSAIDAGKNVFGNYSGNIWPLSRATDTMVAFDGAINLDYFGDASTATCSFAIQSNGTSAVTCAAGELPAVSDKVFNKVLVANNGHWDLTDIENTLGDTPNPVQNKAVVAGLRTKADKTVATQTSDGLMSAADKAKLDSMDSVCYDIYAKIGTADTHDSVYKYGCTVSHTFADINAAVHAGKTPRVLLVDNIDNPSDTRIICPLSEYDTSRSEGGYYFDAPGLIGVSGSGRIYIDENGAMYTCSAGELPAVGANQDGKYLMIDGGKWTCKQPDTATVTAPGFMSAKDKAKLDGVEDGANKTVVDAALDAGSANPVQNKAVKAALDTKAGTAVATQSANGLMSKDDKSKLDGVEAGATKTTVDAALDAASENPVQNKVVKTALDGKLDKTGGTLTGNLNVTGALFSGDGLSFGTGENIHFTKAADDAGKLAHGAAGVDDTVPLARLKVADPTEDDDAATKAYVDGRAAGSGAVRYDAAQTLEAAQKFQARKNIGAVGHDSPQFKGFLSLAPANDELGIGVGLSPSRDGNNFALDISDVNENSPTLLTGVKTPTDANTNAAATVEYVLAKAAGGSTPLTLTYANRQVTGASYSDIRKAIESGRQIKLSVANTPDIIASNARNETNKSVVIFINTDVGGDTVNIAQYTVTAQASGVTGNVKSHELA